MGAPIEEDYPILWVPRWLECTEQRLAVVDATNVGWESMVLWFPDSVVNAIKFRALLDFIWEDHWQIFIPARVSGPLTLAHNISIKTGDVNFLALDAFRPCYHVNSVAAYRF